MNRSLTYYFLFFGILTLIAFIPGAALMVLIATGMALPLLGAPGWLIMAAPTVLLYSIVAIPLLASLRRPNRQIGHIVLATLLLFAAVIGPHLISQKQVSEFAARMSTHDLIKPGAARPRSIELLGDSESGMFAQTVTDNRATCNEVCMRLLFNREADWVRMTLIHNINMGRGPRETRSVTYHLEHRETCPEVYPDDKRIEKAVRDRLVGGDCLIEEAGGDNPPDAVAALTTRYSDPRYPPPPAEKAPGLATVKTVKELQITIREGGQLSLIKKQTETVADVPALPFYIGAEIGMQGGYSGPVLGRSTAVVKAIDLAQALRDTFGYSLATISPPSPEAPRKIAERLLALPSRMVSRFSTQQQDVLNDVLRNIKPSEDNMDFIRSVVADDRVTSPEIGIAIQHMAERNPTLFESLIPIILDRIIARVDQGPGFYKDALGWSLRSFPADSLRPYREKMLRIAENQSDWPSNGVLVRLAELNSDDAISLVVRRLDSSGSRRKFAAIAACRATAEAWPKLEPAVLAHLTPRINNRLDDDESPLLLALVRFGKKAQALEVVQKRRLANETYVTERLDKLSSDFDPNHCHDHL
jgi:hypothetical protein